MPGHSRSQRLGARDHSGLVAEQFVDLSRQLLLHASSVPAALPIRQRDPDAVDNRLRVSTEASKWIAVRMLPVTTGKSRTATSYSLVSRCWRGSWCWRQGGRPGQLSGARCGFSATDEISRSDYGINIDFTLPSGGLVISEKIQLTTEVEATLRKE
jgi:hypothetical protein